MNYAKSKFFEKIYLEFKELLLRDYPSLAEMNIEINTWIINGFGFDVKLLSTSDMYIESRKEKRVIDICTALGGTTYISGHGAKAYQTEEHFENKGIKLEYTDYQPIEYEQ